MLLSFITLLTIIFLFLLTIVLYISKKDGKLTIFLAVFSFLIIIAFY